MDGSLTVFPPWKNCRSAPPASCPPGAGNSHRVPSEIGGEAGIISRDVWEADLGLSTNSLMPAQATLVSAF